MMQSVMRLIWKSWAWLVAACLFPALGHAQDAGPASCMLGVEIGGRCATDWMIRALLVSAAILLVGIVWRTLGTRSARRDWSDELEMRERRGAELGDLDPIAVKDPAEAARRLLRSLGDGAAEYAKRERHRAFEAGDIAAAGAWQNVERAIERQG
jgi:hypothetical protein